MVAVWALAASAVLWYWRTISALEQRVGFNQGAPGSTMTPTGIKYIIHGKKGRTTRWRYLNGEGVMATNAWVESDYYMDSNGIMLTDKWLKLTGDQGEYEWYYFSSSGKG